MSEHNYLLSVEWTGNTGEGTKDYKSFERSLKMSSQGKPDILGSADPAFKGDAAKWNPEEMLLASLSACQMLWYLHLLAVNKIVATSYIDAPVAKLHVEANGDGHIQEAALNPTVTITDASRIEDAKKLHELAHKKCYIARSVNFKVSLNPTIIAQ